MLSFIWWHYDSSAESDDEEEGVNWRLQAQFVTLIDCILYFLSFKFIVYKLSGVSFKFKTQCAAEFYESFR